MKRRFFLKLFTALGAVLGLSSVAIPVSTLDTEEPRPLDLSYPWSICYDDSDGTLYYYEVSKDHLVKVMQVDRYTK